MSDATSKNSPTKGSAADPADKSDTSNRRTGHTGAGQESIRGQNIPEQHDEEHQSGYGGGGVNGGTGAEKK